MYRKEEYWEQKFWIPVHSCVNLKVFYTNRKFYFCYLIINCIWTVSDQILCLGGGDPSSFARLFYVVCKNASKVALMNNLKSRGNNRSNAPEVFTLRACFLTCSLIDFKSGM
jgi:hypothetical protein